MSFFTQSGRRAGPIAALLCAAVLALGLAGCDDAAPWHGTDVSGAVPKLDFTMTRADDGKTVTAGDYRDRVVVLFFGYTSCPDICPTTLSNMSAILGRLGKKASAVRVLFVTVDPDRDTIPALKSYTAAFAPQIDGLRGDPAQIAALAKRYRVSYSVRPKTAEHDYEVSHGSAVYVFDRSGEARLLVSSLATGDPDIEGTTADLARLVEGSSSGGLLDRIADLF